MGVDSIFNEVLSLIVTLIGIAGVLFLAYKCTFWLGNRVGAAYSSKYMSVVDRMSLGQNKYVAVMKVKDKYYLVGVTENSIEILKELEGEFEPVEQSLPTGVNFSDIIKKSRERLKRHEPEE